ncbi:hypothetical protein [Sphingomonas sp.]|uniref:hypothetical protein n=1 Tax=Sphingomonas sp. TaxID=28214 RepID=UPI001B0D3C8D|nr:hypothetical protein [Sphingomonas sp.]MBO9712961.1 hypothetical protein [Sphingomonas sp.]
MMERLEARAEAIGRSGVARAVARLVVLLGEALPGAGVEAGEDQVVVRGRGLIEDPALRWIAGWFR